MKILLLDIETAPNLVHVWGLFKQNVSISQIIDSSYVMCWSAKWLGEDTIYFDSVRKSGPKRMLKKIHKMLEEADAVIHYNGSRFDIPTLNKEFLLKEMSPPATYQQIDLLKTARTKFRFPSNKLDYVAQSLKLGSKTKHSGHDLWVRCLAGEELAWEQMEEYNKNDVILLEAVYYKLLPWITNHPNTALIDDTDGCPNCGSLDSLKKRGFYHTSVGKYQRYQCNVCHSWHKNKKAEKTSHTKAPIK
jgi:DNA polymerase elongation subunit (family B)